MFVILFAVLLGTTVEIVESLVLKDFFGFGMTILQFLASSFVWIGMYYVYWMLRLPGRLSYYHYTLYEVNPANSEVIKRLSQMLNNYTYVMAGWFAIATLFLASDPILAWAILPTILVFWIPTVMQFASNQIALGRIITTAKWKTLNEILAT